MANEQTDAAVLPEPKPPKAAKSPSTVSADPLSELERKHAKELEKAKFHETESRSWSTKARATAAQMREIKEKRVHDFIKTAGLADISPEAWKAAEASIKAALAKASTQAAG